MLKCYCDICGDINENDNFFFEASILRTTVDIASELPTPQKRQNKQVIHVCEDCYKKHISKLLDNAKKEKK